MNLLPWRNALPKSLSTDTRPRVIVVGQSPPPYHGQAIMIQNMVQGLDQALIIHHVPMRYSLTIDDVGLFSFRKIIHLISLIITTLGLLLRHRNAVLYYPPAGPHRVPVLRDIAFLLAVRPFARKTIFHFHTIGLGRYIEEHSALRWWAIRAYQKPDASIILVNSHRADAEYIQSQRIYVVPNGLTIPLRAHVPSQDDKTRILYVGIHEQVKGIRDMIETARVLKEKGFAFVIHSVGEWRSEEERTICENLVRTYNLNEEVQFCGRLVGDAKWDMFAASDIFFFPTYHPAESFGIVLLESMAYGLPVVSTDWHGPKDVVDNGVTGILCPIHDTHAFAAAIMQIASDRTTYTAMSQAAQARYQQFYTEEAYLKHLNEVFHQAYLAR